MKDLYLLMNGDLPLLTLQRLLRLIENGCNFIALKVFCDSITVKDLCTLRKVVSRILKNKKVAFSDHAQQ